MQVDSGTQDPCSVAWNAILVLGAPVDLWRDLRDATREIRHDWDLSVPGLREACDAGDFSPFHGWDRRAARSAE